MKILVIGSQIRYIVCSGKKGKHEMYTVSYFDSVDQRRCAKISKSYLHKNVSLKFAEQKEKVMKFMLNNAKEILENNEIDAIIPKKNSKEIEKFKIYAEIYSSDYINYERANNKYELFKIAKNLNINTPYTEILKSNDKKEIIEISKNINFPVIIKPVYGSSGVGNIKIENEKDIENLNLKKDKEYIIQKFIKGKNYSINMVSNGFEVKEIFFAEQVLGKKFLNAKFPFQYCGNIGYVNLKDNFLKNIAKDFSDLILNLNIKGVCGGDFVVDENGKFYLIEINPRFQGSTDVVEETLNLSLVDLHIAAFKNKNFEKIKIPKQKKIQKIYTSLILYAKKKCRLKEDISNENFIRDIPFKNSIFDENAPIATVIGEGKNVKECLNDAKMKTKFIYDKISS